MISLVKKINSYLLNICKLQVYLHKKSICRLGFWLSYFTLWTNSIFPNIVSHFNLLFHGSTKTHMNIPLLCIMHLTAKSNILKITKLIKWKKKDKARHRLSFYFLNKILYVQTPVDNSFIFKLLSCYYVFFLLIFKVILAISKLTMTIPPTI